MKHFAPLGVVLALASGCSSVSAAPEIAGQWCLKLDTHPEATKQHHPSECTVRQQGTELGLKCGDNQEIKGELRGRTVVFRYEKTGIPPMVEDRLVVTFAGELNESATVIVGAMTLVSSVLDHEKINFEMRKPSSAK